MAVIAPVASDDRDNLANRHRHGDAWVAAKDRPSLPEQPANVRVAILRAMILIGTLLIWAGLIMASCTGKAEAAAVSSGPRNALLSWGAVTTFTDGSTISAPVTYRVYAGLQGAPMALITELPALTLLLQNQPLGVMCYRVTAVANAVESDSSTTLCKTMRPPAPTEGAVEAPTDGAIER